MGLISLIGCRSPCYVDDKVSVVGRDKILALEGGGEDSVAYILLYRSPVV